MPDDNHPPATADTAPLLRHRHTAVVREVDDSLQNQRNVVGIPGRARIALCPIEYFLSVLLKSGLILVECSANAPVDRSGGLNQGEPYCRDCGFGRQRMRR